MYIRSVYNCVLSCSVTFVAGKYSVPIANFTSDQDYRLWTGAENPSDRADQGSVWYSRIRFAGNCQLRTDRSRIGHMVCGSYLLRAVSGFRFTDKYVFSVKKLNSRTVLVYVIQILKFKDFLHLIVVLCKLFYV